MYFNKILVLVMLTNSIQSFSLNSALNNNKIQNYKLNMKINNDDSPTNSNEEASIIQEINNEIYYYGPIVPQGCYELKNKLNELDIKSKMVAIQYGIRPPPIHLHIQSQGGTLYHTLYIMDLIKNLDTPVHTYVDGFAASAASLICVVGKKRYMTKNSLILIHQLSGADSGKYEELKDQLSNMNSLMQIIVTTYLNNTSMSLDELNSLLRKDIWLNSSTCLKYGLIDKII
tara:strand:+ start:19289 stop:19978 length:690 start_codon:yes stop_codon:yes gene_type:complete